ncbi:amino acid adenylation domain-containing protein [Streptomyces zhihengii]|uniref:non-ribosomal peptide synthetase n=1 Tax=Streptomyces zhihengii TaxID=1818004 RepID=UPI00363DF052
MSDRTTAPARLSSGQERLVWLHDLDPAHGGYHLPLILRLAAGADTRAVSAALDALAARHAVLGSRCVRDETGSTFQVPVPDFRVPLTRTRESRPGEWREIAGRALAEPFALFDAPPVRALIVDCADGSSVVMLAMHHLACDGRSLWILTEEFTALHRAALHGTEPELAPVTRTYADFAAAEHAELSGKVLADRLAHWRGELAGMEAASLPGDLPEPRPGTTAIEIAFGLPAEHTRALEELAARHRAPLTAAVGAAFQAWLAWHTHQRDITVGLALDARRGRLDDGVVGFFVRNLLLRGVLEPGTTFTDLMRQLTGRLRTSRKQHLPYERILAEAGAATGRGTEPVSAFLIHHGTRPPADGTADGVTRLWLRNDAARFDIELNTAVADGRLTGDIRFRSGLFSRHFPDEAVARFVRLLERATAEPDTPLDRLALLSPDELRVCAATGRSRPATAGGAPLIPDLLRARIRTTPDRTALVHGSTRLTYAQLGRRAGHLARLLTERGIGPEQRVALLVPRSDTQVVALLAVLMAGGVCVPLDTDQPAVRTRAMLRDAGVALLLDTRDTAAHLGDLPGPGPARLTLGDLPGAGLPEQEDGGAPPLERAAVRGEHAAYVIHTSGSTGRPKGVVVEHRQLAHLHAEMVREVFAPGARRLGRDRLRVALTAALTFDASWQGLLALVDGHELHLVPDRVRRDAEAHADHLAEHAPDLVDATPTHAEQLLDAGLFDRPGRPAIVLLGGEPVHQALWDRFRHLPGVEVRNYYGPTEFTVNATTCLLDGLPTPRIGRPLGGLGVSVLDRSLRPVPPGVRGEIHLHGPQIARGYGGQPGLTASRFVADPFGPPGSRMYRTGDVGRWDAEGRLAFEGRADDQIKLRGFRIEPGEIESALLSHAAVRQAAVVARPGPDGLTRLIAYAVLRDGAADRADGLRAHLAARLPRPMVPDGVVPIAALPLTPSGKLDRRALPDPAPAAHTGPPDTAGAPRSPREAVLCRLFAQTLDTGDIGRDDDFFALGGHSLLVTRLLVRIRSVLGADLRIRDVFDRPTPAALAPLLTRQDPRPPLTPRTHRGDVPLSAAQRRLWFLARAGGASDTYNIPQALRISGPLDADALERALEDVVARHEPLRTVFPERDGVPRQHVLASHPGPLLVRTAVREDDLPAALDEAQRHAFDLTGEPPLRCVLFRITAERHVLLLLVHHIAGDARSGELLRQDLAAAYEARLRGDAPAYPPLPVRYTDYALWHHEALGDEHDPASPMSRQSRYWRERLAGLPAEIALPADRPRPALPPARSHVEDFDLDRDTHRALAALAGEEGVSLTMALQAAVALLLHRAGAGTDIPLGGVVSTRVDEQLGDLVGFFVNTQVLRFDLSGAPDFRTLLRRVRETTLSAYDHHDLPFERVVEVVNPPRSVSRHPLFQVMTVVQDRRAGDGFTLGGLACRPEPTTLASAKFDLCLTFGERTAPDGAPDGIAVRLEARADMYGTTTVARLADRLRRLTAAACAGPRTPVVRLDMLHEAEAAALARLGTGAVTPVPARTVPELFSRRAAARPDATAVRWDTGRLGYAELDDWTGRIAAALRAAGLAREDRVALLLERSAAAVAAPLGVLKAAACYVPLHPGDPDRRLRRIITGSGARLLITDAAHAERAAALGLPALVLSGNPEDPPAPATAPAGSLQALPAPATAPAGSLQALPAPATAPAGNPEDPPAPAESLQDPPAPATAPAGNPEDTPAPAGAPHLLPEHLAYVIHTSGSTGEPKGVAVSHRAVVELAVDRRWQGGGHERVLMHSPLAFDASTYELWVPLLNGGEVVVAPASGLDADTLREVLRAGRVTGLWLTSGLFQVVADLAPGALGGLREVWAGGDVVPPASAARVAAHCPDTSVVNGYGPTETTTFAASHPLDPAAVPEHVLPIGTPLDNTRLHVLDEALAPVPPGVPGELYIAGAGLARGYLGRPALTAERFVACPYGPPGGRMYRTGDLVRWDEGALVFLGRGDQQTKLRGFRIEPGEVEAALTRHPAVRRATAVVRHEEGGDGRLVAYVTTDRPAPDAAGLRTFLAERLPPYLVPSDVVPLDALPLTANGKIDRRALPAPPPRDTPDTTGTPGDAVTRTLCRVFADVLGHAAEFAPHRDFFAAGGSSLSVIRLISRVRGALGAEPTVRDVFEEPTPAGLAARLAAAGDRAPSRPALRPGAAGGEPVLAPAQHGLWFLQQLPAERAAYNVPFALRLTGPLDVTALRRALHDLAARHDALRTRCPERDGVPSPATVAPGDLPDLLTVRGVTAGELPGHLRAEGDRPFDLSRELPLRAVLFTTGTGEHTLSLVFHHIAVDGWSLEPLWRDLGTAYRSRAAGGAPGWEPLPVGYADYAAWQHRLLGDPGRPTAFARRQLDFWRTALADLPDELPLPYDHPRPGAGPVTAGRVALHWEPAVHGRLAAVAEEAGTSLLVVAHAAVAALLHRIGAGGDIPLGTPVAGRTDEALDDLVGYFVNTVVLRLDVTGEPDFRALVRRARDTALSSFARQDIPFDRLVEELAPRRAPSRNPLFQTMVTCLPAGGGAPDLGTVSAAMEETRLGSAKFDLAFEFQERAGGTGLDCRLLYRAELFEAETAERLAAELHALVTALSARPGLPVTAAPASRTAPGSGHETPPPPVPSVPETLWQRIAATPDLPALADDGERLTFRRLGERVEDLAHALHARGIGPEDRVAVLLPRSARQITALLAVLAAGGAAVPLDVSHPPLRTAEVLRAAGVSLLLTDSASAGRLGALPGIERLDLDSPPAPAPAPPAGRRRLPSPRGEHAAYLIHTSGSTGRPKGVLVEHRQLANLLSETTHRLLARPDGAPDGRRLRVSLTASLAFDASWQGVLALVAGHELHIAPESTRSDPGAYTRYLLDRRVDAVDVTPTYLAELLDAGLLDDPAHAPRLLLVGGERIGPDLWSRLRAAERTRAVNVYGPTECTVDATACPLDERPAPRIGRPLGGTAAYVLDDALRPVPPLVRGELYLAGAQVARGYAEQPAMTAERFVADPYGPPGARMYRTGDLAHWDAADHLVFDGRADDQVKIRGFRVEPGEVEAALARHPAVGQAAVVVREDDPGDPRLVAYTVPAGDGCEARALRDHLAERLPAHLVPSAFVRVGALPLTTSGKLDRRALPAPRPEDAAAGSGGAARGPLEELLCQEFAEVLGVTGVGPEDDFFALGGHSLLAVRLTGRVRGLLGLEPTVQDLMRGRSAAGLLRVLRGGPGHDPMAAVLPLRTAAGTPLFCVHPVTGLSWCYAGLARHLPAHVPVLGFQPPTLSGTGRPPGDLRELAADYVRSMRRVQPRGPYRILGWSFGGNAAHAMACALQHAGEEVSLLALLDSYPLADVAARAPGPEPDPAAVVRDHLTDEALRGLTPEHLRRLETATARHLRLGPRAVPGVFHGDVLLVTAEEPGRPAWLGPGLWEPYTDGKPRVESVPFTHLELMSPGAQERIAGILAPRLA